jgi:hypothetical protein
VPRCSATKRDGELCRISVEPGVEFCWAHDPANREQRQRIADNVSGGQEQAKQRTAVDKGEAIFPRRRGARWQHGQGGRCRGLADTERLPAGARDGA